MAKRKIIQFFLFLVALSLQILFVPLIGENFFLANALLSLSIIFSLKETRIESIIWGAILGGVSDLILFQHIGFYGIAFVVSSYILGFFSHKMVISGIFPIVLISIIFYSLVVLISFGLMTLFQGKVDFVLLLAPFFLGMLFVPMTTLIFEFFYRKLEKLALRK